MPFGYRTCEACHKEKPLAHFAIVKGPYMRSKRSAVCRQCEAKGSPTQ